MVVIKKVTVKLLSKALQGLRRSLLIVAHHPKALFLAGIMIGSFFGYTISILMTEASYRLTSQSTQLIGGANRTLADKLKLDKNLGAYRFNAESVTAEMTGETEPSKIAALLASQKQQTGGAGKDSRNLYSLDLPIDPSAGTKVYDINSKTSFKLIPEFDMGAGRSQDGRVVYPLDDGGQAVYTVKANGIKEDIVLQKPRGNALSFKYTLELPKTLEARLDERGNLGIYSVDPSVSSAIAGALQNRASSTDTARLKDVQENGTKDFLTYLIPAPTILQSGNHPKGHAAKAIYKLNGNQLTVETAGLQQLVYPISIDPTVVVTSTSDFITGNNEENISFDAGAISRAPISGGTIGAWASTTSLATAAPTNHASVAYNGYLYTTGGFDGTNNLADVQYAPINADGTLGGWTATTSLPAGRVDHVPVVYNGYMYVTGGQPTYDDVQYATINPDGSIGNWTATTSLFSNRYSHTSVAYGGYIYVIGGQDDLGNELADVQYARINANGTLGTWGMTTSFTTARSNQGSVVYNGYLYIIGGQDVANARLADVQYAPINANGTLGTWTATTSFTTARSSHATAVYNGYVYVVGGWDTAGTRLADVQYARINANGTLGAWTATTSFPTARSSQVTIIYNGYMYITGGNGLSGRLSDVQYAKIDTAKDVDVSAWTTTTAFGALGQQAKNRILTRMGHSSVVYNGYIYLIGGANSGPTVANIDYAPLNADGTVGAWVLTTPLPAARAGQTSLAYNGYIYAFGGQDTAGAITATSYYAPLNADGTVGTWTTTTVLPVASSEVGIATHNGYVYLTGGTTATGVFTNQVRYAPINANGTIGTWVSSTGLPANRGIHASMTSNGFLYVIGGYDGSAATGTVLMAPINANGTIGTWSTTSSLLSPRYYIDAYIYNNYVFIAGGRTTGSVEINSSMYAKINTDGTLGTWTAGTSFTTARSNHTTVINNGYMYIAGGWNGTTYYGDVQYASLMPAVGGTQAWQSATATNLSSYGQGAAVYNNFIYNLGGFGGGGYRNQVRYAPLNADGTIGTWVTSANVLVKPRFNGYAVAYKGYMYMTGGQEGTSLFTNTTEYAPINADGTVGTWTLSPNTFTTARYGHVSVAYNGKLYVIGGGDSANVALSDVKYATINADGSIGTWSDTTATTAARDTDGFVYGGRIYIFGGVNGTVYSNTVRHAPINSDGTLGAWVTASSQFATARSRHAVAVVNGYAYLSGGGTSGLFADLQYAPINSDGTIGPWRTGSNHSTVSGAPPTYAYHSMVANRGKLYSFSGINSSNVEQSVAFATTLNAPALTSTYTKQINLGLPSTLNGITLNGLMPFDQNVVMFRTAGTDGVYGNWQLPSVLSTPMTNVQYVMYKVAFDDSSNSSLASTGGVSSLADITLDYTFMPILTTENRLRQNKYFDANGLLQPLQTQ